ncbi:MAG TPA: 3-phosphoshikimate 1-carboxyvinyltransferase [Rhodanobacteraceae bacterium]|nr:3-phosphoshikimate 1-carboxyvinyltransferase [Rhodanobacteraceae bacterium]
MVESAGVIATANDGSGDWICSAAGPWRGELTVPGDKSVSHRALMLAALADGTSSIVGFLDSGDTRATATILGSLGVRIEAPSAQRRIVHGVGLRGLRPAQAALDCGNAGTAMRLLCGLLAGQGFDSVLTGDASLSRRPMRRVADPLAAMGARIDSEDGHAPLRIAGGQPLRGVRHRLAVASAQVKSALLLAGLYADGSTEVIEPRPTRDYTERMLAAFGYAIDFEPGRARLHGGGRLQATDIVVPADFSSAAFFVVAACIVPGSQLCLRGVGLNPRRTGLLEALRLMGADITVENAGERGGELVGDLVVRHRPLHGVEIPAALVSDMIDEFPALFVAAAAADGRITVSGAAELRVKESDRIAAMAAGLRALGCSIEEQPDGAVIEGRGGTFAGGHVDSHGDHRVAMAFAVAGAHAAAPVRVCDCAPVATSFPNFAALANACVGLD